MKGQFKIQMKTISIKNRNDEIDIMKGILIILVVVGHSGMGGHTLTNWISLFHMPVFFMISGYLYKKATGQDIKKIKAVRKYIIKKIKSLWVPYFVASVIFIILNNFFIRIGFYTNSINIENVGNGNKIHNFMSISEILRGIFKAFFWASHTELGGTFWFFKALFMVSCMYFIIDCIIAKIVGEDKSKKNIILQTIISVFLLIAGFVCSQRNISLFGIGRSFSIYCLFHLGRVIKIMQTNTKKSITYEAIISFIIIKLLGKC